MALAVERVFPTPKGYKGCIRYALLQTKSGVWKVEKRRSRPIPWDSRIITEAEAKWCDSRMKAEKLWVYHNMMGTASWWGGDIIHPMHGKDWTLIAIENYRKKLHRR